MARIKEEFCKVSVGRRVLGVCKEEQKDSLAGNAIQEVIAVGWGGCVTLQACGILGFPQQ